MLNSQRHDLTPVKRALAGDTADRTGRTGSLADVLAGADVYIGVSGGTVPEEVVATMADDAIIFGLANPTPRCTPRWPTGTPRWSRPVARTSPTRSTTCWPSPASSAGAFDVRATAITEGDEAGRGRRHRRPGRATTCAEDYIVPSPFDPRVGPAVAAAVAAAARVAGDGVAPPLTGGRPRGRVGPCSPSTPSPSPPTTRSTGLVVGERPDPEVPDGWTTVTVKAASLNHHDLWSLRGVGLREEALPMILGCDAAGLDEDGNEVVVHAVIARPVVDR